MLKNNVVLYNDQIAQGYLSQMRDENGAQKVEVMMHIMALVCLLFPST